MGCWSSSFPTVRSRVLPALLFVPRVLIVVLSDVLSVCCGFSILSVTLISHARKHYFSPISFQSRQTPGKFLSFSSTGLLGFSAPLISTAWLYSRSVFLNSGEICKVRRHVCMSPPLERLVLWLLMGRSRR